MHATAQPHDSVGQVSDFERDHFRQERQRHVGDLGHVTLPVRLRDTADYHVGVTYGLHLW